MANPRKSAGIWRLGASARRRARFGVPLAACLVLGGCTESLPVAELPSLAKDPRKLLTAEQQQQAIRDLTLRREAEKWTTVDDTAKRR